MKKKSLPLLIVFFSLIIFAGCTSKKVHPRLKRLVNVNSIQIWSEHPYASTREKQINDKDDIEAVLAFIKEVKYKRIKLANQDNDVSGDYWKFRFKFDDRYREIFFYDNYADLGKNRYKIQSYIADDFLILYESL